MDTTTILQSEIERLAQKTSERLASALLTPDTPSQHWAALGVYATWLNRKIFALEELP